MAFARGLHCRCLLGRCVSCGMRHSRRQAGDHALGCRRNIAQSLSQGSLANRTIRGTEDGRIFCSGGVYAAIDLSLYLVEKFCGHEIALKCAKSLLLSMPRGRQSGYSVVQLSRPHSDEKIRETEEYLQQHFDGDISIDRLAERVGMGPRNFIRRFKAATGRVPGTYLQMLRVSAAKEMLETGRSSIQTVSSKIGYEDIGFFRNLFKRHTGMTPGEYRERFSQMRFERGELVAERH